MFCPKFLNSLQQPLKDNSWPTHSTNQNYKMRFHRQCDSVIDLKEETMNSEDTTLVVIVVRNGFQ